VKDIRFSVRFQRVGTGYTYVGWSLCPFGFRVNASCFGVPIHSGLQACPLRRVTSGRLSTALSAERDACNCLLNQAEAAAPGVRRLLAYGLVVPGRVPITESGSGPVGMWSCAALNCTVGAVTMSQNRGITRSRQRILVAFASAIAETATNRHESVRQAV